MVNAAFTLNSASMALDPVVTCHGRLGLPDPHPAALRRGGKSAGQPVDGDGARTRLDIHVAFANKRHSHPTALRPNIQSATALPGEVQATRLAARGERPAAFDRRCIAADGVGATD